MGLHSRLHLVGPLGFSIDDKQVKRAGLDYWENLDLVYHKSRHDWLRSLDRRERVYLIETTGEPSIFEIDFQPGDYLVFGRETTGIPLDVLEQFPGQIYRIPFPGPIRSFNLSNCVAMTMGEGLRQLRVKGLDTPHIKD